MSLWQASLLVWQWVSLVFGIMTCLYIIPRLVLLRVLQGPPSSLLPASLITQQLQPTGHLFFFTHWKYTYIYSHTHRDIFGHLGNCRINSWKGDVWLTQYECIFILVNTGNSFHFSDCEAGRPSLLIYSIIHATFKICLLEPCLFWAFLQQIIRKSIAYLIRFWRMCGYQFILQIFPPGFICL